LIVPGDTLCRGVLLHTFVINIFVINIVLTPIHRSSSVHTSDHTFRHRPGGTRVMRRIRLITSAQSRTAARQGCGIRRSFASIR